MGRTAKDPSKPKKLSAYAFFLQDIRAELKRNDPDKKMDISSFSKEASEKWKNISEKDKKKYNDLAKKDKEKYDREMSSYVPPEMTDDSKKRKRSKKDPNAPKRSMSSFFLFANEMRPKVRAEFPKMAVKDVSKELGRRWETCKERSKYDELAAKDRARYEAEKAEYVANGQTNGETEAKKPAAKAAAKKTTSKPPPKKSKQESEDEEDEDEDEEVDDEEEEDEDDGDESD